MSERIAYQGAEGAYSYIAASALYPKATKEGYSSFDDVFDAMKEHRVEGAVLPIENSVIGSIFEVYDLLWQYDYKISGEMKLRIDHNLLTVPKTKIQDVKTVYSHPKALGQCRKFFKEHPWLTPVVYEDTAAAARHVAEVHDPTIAAIASATAGELYGLSIVRSQIQSDPNNYTRFVTVAENHGEMAGNKSSVVFSTADEPGSLVRCMLPFDRAHLNLTSVHSRPLIGQPWKYLFYLDFEHPDHSDIQFDVYTELTPNTSMFRILGTYPRGEVLTEKEIPLSK